MMDFLRRRCCAVVLISLVGCGVTTNAARSAWLNDVRSTETLVWSDEFNGSTAGSTAQSAPDIQNWTYDTGNGGWGNHELETYCAYGSNTAPCDVKNPNAYVGGDGYLHIVTRNPANGVYTSARIKSQGLKSFQYGRMEARIKIPEGSGYWPAFWLLGNDIETAGWPSCGEIDVMENVGKTPHSVSGSIHGDGINKTTVYTLDHDAKFGDAFHIFGILWSPGEILFYVDSPTNIYATYTRDKMPHGSVWPFDSQKFFFILNVAVGGNWPGSPNATTAFPQEMLVDYMRVYAESAGIPAQ
jgi:beta-glucanase (GH16 family)